MNTDVIVALISAVAVLGAAWIAGRPARKSKEFLEQHVGASNGKGTVVQMLENQIAWSARHDHQENRRFKAVFDHLGIPDPEDEEPTVG